MRLIDNWKAEFNRLWSIRVALAYGVFNGVALVIGAFFPVINPWLLLGIGLFVSVGIIVLRLMPQDDPAIAKAMEPSE